MERFVGARHRDRLRAGLLQDPPDGLALVGIVVHDEHHGRPQLRGPIRPRRTGQHPRAGLARG
jgi:hypothetical protein